MNIVTKIRLLHALVKVTRNRKREIAMLLQDSRFSICSVTLQMVSTCEDVDSKYVRGNVRGFSKTDLLTLVGPLKPISSALCVNIESLMRLPFSPPDV